ncbi:MAG: acyloxyacyl hydrolase [Gammaproteobacteria bacterium]|nr:acyloxyacyl hydrolase [Gammaproteobacteria bacterium]
MIKHALMTARVVAACLLGGGLFGVANVAAEEQPLIKELRFGVLAHDVDGLWSGSRREEGIDLNVEMVFGQPSLKLPLGALRPNLGASINTSGDTSKVYAGVLWQIDFESGLFIDLGLGGAIHDGETDTFRPDRKRLGSHLQFRIPIEIGYSPDGRNRFSIMFDHISNADLADPNEGLDTLGIRYSYRF